LIGLFAYPDADCWIVEGEKAAFALETLLPNHPVLTWQGGSNATAKADYMPLEKRHCIVFRDNDPAGMKACRTLIDQLKAVKAASIRVLNISKLQRAPGQPLQAGDDAADLVAAGWTAEHFAEFLKRDGVLIDADAFTRESDQDGNEASDKQPDDAGTVERFTLFDKGLFVNEQHKDGSIHVRWICSPIKPLAMVRTEHGREWGLLIWLVDPDGKPKK
jgi:5S rRNA maturation endonuclease (ribonuclease M5)